MNFYIITDILEMLEILLKAYTIKTVYVNKEV